MNVFRGQVCKAWMAAPRRRSQKGPPTWEKLKTHSKERIPPTRPFPTPYQRLIVTYSR